MTAVETPTSPAVERRRLRLQRQWRHAIAQRDAVYVRLQRLWAEMDALDEREATR